VPRLRRSDHVGESMPQPCRAGLTFGGRPYGPQSPDRFFETHFQNEPAEPQIPIQLRSGQALGYARDDKGNGGASVLCLMMEEPAVKGALCV
jgi:hypothetical protein